MNMENKVAIVAGGARDIGRAISEKPAAAVTGDMTQQADVENLVSVTQTTFLTSKFVIPNMGKGGSVVNLASLAGQRIRPTRNSRQLRLSRHDRDDVS